MCAHVLLLLHERTRPLGVRFSALVRIDRLTAAPACPSSRPARTTLSVPARTARPACCTRASIALLTRSQVSFSRATTVAISCSNRSTCRRSASRSALAVAVRCSTASAWATVYPRSEPYDLAELARALPAHWRRPSKPADLATAPGRNCALFAALCKLALGGSDEGLLTWARTLNREFSVPLADAEVRGVWRSVCRYRARWRVQGHQ